MEPLSGIRVPSAFPSAVPCPDTSCPPPDPAERFPCFPGTLRCSAALSPLPPPFVSFAGRSRPALASSLLEVWRAAPPHPERWSPGAPAGIAERRAAGLPGSWVNLPGAPALLSDPGGTLVPGLYGTTRWPSAVLTTSASSRRSFRGWITRPAPSLSTLRSTGYPATTPASLPAGGQP